MHLADAGGGQRFRLKVLEQLLQGGTELLLDHAAHRLEGFRPGLILQLGQFFHPGGGQQVRAAGQDLPDLQKGAALFQGGLAEAARVLAVQGGESGLLHAGGQERRTRAPEPVTGHHPGEHPAGHGEPFQPGGPALRLAGQLLALTGHVAGAALNGAPGGQCLLRQLTALPGGAFDGFQRAFHHRQPGAQAAVLLVAAEGFQRRPVAVVAFHVGPVSSVDGGGLPGYGHRGAPCHLMYYKIGQPDRSCNGDVNTCYKITRRGLCRGSPGTATPPGRRARWSARAAPFARGRG